MYNFFLSTPVSIFISLAALAGVTLHDTKIDRLATSFVGIPAHTAITDTGAKSMASEPHTHVERVTLSDVKTAQPRLAPRYGEQKKHLLQKSVPKGNHLFDGYNLPIA